MTTTRRDAMFDTCLSVLEAFVAAEPNDEAHAWALAAHLTANLEAFHPGNQIIRGCDGCDRTYDADLIDAADLTPTFTDARDRNGDIDVSICGACIAEHRDNPDPAEIAQREADMLAVALLDVREGADQ